MNINQLKASVSEKKIENLYLFYGPEDYLIRLYISQIKDIVISNKSLEDLNFVRFEKFSEKSFEEAVSTPPVFSEKKLVLFDETGVFKSPSADAKKFLEENLPEIPDFVTVIFREESIDKRQKKLLEAVEKKGASVEFERMTEEQLKSWINILVSKNGKKISVGSIEYFIQCVGTSMSAIENEVGKLCSFSKNEVISKEDIDNIVTKSIENRIFELSGAITSKNTAKTFKILSELKLLREEPIRITALIAKNFCDMYAVKSASPRSIKSLKMHPYAVKLHQNAKISRKKIGEIISDLAVADEKMKSSPVDSWLILEHFVSLILAE